MPGGGFGGRGRVVRIENADDMEMELSRDAQSLASVNPSPSPLVPLTAPPPLPRRFAFPLESFGSSLMLVCSIPLHSLLASGFTLKEKRKMKRG
jgi:hypothetical protein